MKQLTCEMCGGTDFLKQDGVFACQTCGLKYTLEEARKIMNGDGSAPPASPSAPNNTALIENYISLAKTAIDSSNNAEAENYANKVIEIDPQNSAAWEIKGKAAGWQSKGNNNRSPESVTAWLNAIKYASDDEVADVRTRIAGEYVSLFYAIVQLKAGFFAELQTDDNASGLLVTVRNGFKLMNSLMSNGGVSFNRGPVHSEIVKKLNSAACDGYKDAKKDFGPEHRKMTQWQWERFYKACDNCILLLEEALKYVRDKNQGTTICENLITIAEDAKDSCSWEFDVHSYSSDHYVMDRCFTSEAKRIRASAISGFKTKKEYFSEDPALRVLNEIGSSRTAEEERRAKEKYWEDHADEKAKLEEERAGLIASIPAKEASLKNHPIRSEISRLFNEINSAKQEYSILGAFKGKEKKALEEKISDLEAKKAELNGQAQSACVSIQQEINNMKARISAIDAEFSKSRGRIETPDEEVFLPGAVEDGRFNFTPQQLSDHLAKVLPEPYVVEALDEGEGLFGPFKTITFTNPDLEDEDNEFVNVSIECIADSDDTPVKCIVLNTGNNRQVVDPSDKDLAIIGSYLFRTLFKDFSRNKAESEVLNLKYSGDRTLWVSDEIRYEYAQVPNEFMTWSPDYFDDLIILRPSKGR